jgi:hypothetical protein
MTPNLHLLAASAMAALIVAGCDSNMVPIEGAVVSVTHECRYDIRGAQAETLRDQARAGRSIDRSNLTGDCSNDPDFLQVRANPDGHNVRFSGSAKVKVTFVSPIDNSSVDSEIRFDGDDDEFYTMIPGQPVPLRVDKTDHSRVRYAG